MARPILVPLSFAVLLFSFPPVAAAGTSGPFAGTVAQGETDTHQFNNNPLNQPCLQVMTDYTVRLTYEPPTDTLTLEAAGRTAVGANGGATLGFQRSVCTSFTIRVTGTDVDLSAAYVVTVTSGGGGAAAASGPPTFGECYFNEEAGVYVVDNGDGTYPVNVDPQLIECYW